MAGPDILNDVHIGAVLVMLPFDADKVAALADKIDFKVNGQDASDVDPDALKAGDRFSFLDTQGETVEFELLARKSGANGDDLSAFRNVEIRDVVVAYPGLNDPGSDAMGVLKDLFNGNSANESFVGQFHKELDELLSKEDHITLFSHSSGDGELAYGASYFAEHGYTNTRNIITNPWDVSDAAKIYLKEQTQQALAGHEGIKLDDVKKAVDTAYDDFNQKTTLVSGDAQGAIGMMADNDFVVDKSISIHAGHKAGELLFLSEKEIADKEGGANAKDVQRVKTEAFAESAAELGVSDHAQNNSVQNLTPYSPFFSH